MTAEQLSRPRIESTAEESVETEYGVRYGQMYGQIYDLGLEADLQTSVVERLQAVIGRMAQLKAEIMRGNASDEVFFEYMTLEHEKAKLTEYCMSAGLPV